MTSYTRTVWFMVLQYIWGHAGFLSSTAGLGGLKDFIGTFRGDDSGLWVLGYQLRASKSHRDMRGRSSTLKLQMAVSVNWGSLLVGVLLIRALLFWGLD